MDKRVVKIKLGPRATLPVQRDGDSGADVHAAYDGVVQAWQTVRCDLDFALEVPPGFEAQIRPRSGNDLKSWTVSLGTVDSNYRGTVSAILRNCGSQPWHYKAGDRIAQMVIVPVVKVLAYDPVSELSETSRGSSGFGSSGTGRVPGNGG